MLQFIRLLLAYVCMHKHILTAAISELTLPSLGLGKTSEMKQLEDAALKWTLECSQSKSNPPEEDLLMVDHSKCKE
jgi:hypothetical protein